MISAVIVGLALGIVGVRTIQRRGGFDEGVTRPRVVEIPRVVEAIVEPPLMRTIYLNREGALLQPGFDDARRNRSSILKSLGDRSVDYAAFAGTPRRWTQIVDCVREKFAPFAVDVVERRPVDRDYLMAMVGGRPADLGQAADEHGDGHAHSHATGLAPFNGEPIAHAIVFVFSRALNENARTTCETAAMEIAHAYGLDHTRHCRDAMTYMRPCGKKRFLDEAIPCGEHEDRPCRDGTPTQNSFQRLLTMLGPRPAGS